MVIDLEGHGMYLKTQAEHEAEVRAGWAKQARRLIERHKEKDELTELLDALGLN